MFIPAFLSSPLAFSVPTFVRNLLPILTAGLGAPVLKLGAVVGVPSWCSLLQLGPHLSRKGDWEGSALGRSWGAKVGLGLTPEGVSLFGETFTSQLFFFCFCQLVLQQPHLRTDPAPSELEEDTWGLLRG